MSHCSSGCTATDCGDWTVYCPSTELQASSSSEQEYSSRSPYTMWLWVVLLSPEQENGNKKLLASVSLCRAEPAAAAGVRRGHTSPCVKWCASIACVFPGPNGQSNVSEDTVPIRQQSNTGSASCKVACRETWPRVVEPANANSGFDAPKFSRNCDLFVRLPFPDNGKLQLVLVTLVGMQVGTQIGGSYDGRTGNWLVGSTPSGVRPKISSGARRH